MLEFAVPGSKFEGTGLENEQIVQTHVALLDLGVLDPEPGAANGLAPRWTGDPWKPREGDCPDLCPVEEVNSLEFWIDDLLAALG